MASQSLHLCTVAIAMYRCTYMYMYMMYMYIYMYMYMYMYILSDMYNMWGIFYGNHISYWMHQYVYEDAQKVVSDFWNIFLLYMKMK